MNWLGDGLVIAQAIATAACGAFNATHFLGYLRPSQWRGQRPARKVAAVTLLVIGAAAAVESLYFLALYAAYHRGGNTGAAVAALLSPGPWLVARLLAFMGMTLVTLLILRQQAHNGR